MAETLAVIALLVSFASLAVSIIASVVLADRIKKQARQPARQTTRLEPPARAINHLREALFDIGNEGTVTSKTANSIHEAMHLSAVVFSHEVRNGLNRVYVTAVRLRKPAAGRTDQDRTDQDTQDTIALAKNLQTLIARMNEEAASTTPSAGLPPQVPRET
jgi:K+-sensing histidine kinase KdpD